jgi:hypothetical protein
MDHDGSSGKVRARPDFEYAFALPADASARLEVVDHSDRVGDRALNVARRERAGVHVTARAMTDGVRGTHSQSHAEQRRLASDVDRPDKGVVSRE